MAKTDELFKQYNIELNDDAIKADIEKIISKEFAANNNSEVYKTCLSLIDLTSLNSTDTTAARCLFKYDGAKKYGTFRPFSSILRYTGTPSPKNTTLRP